MSALGHKQTCAPQKDDVRFAPDSDAKADSRKRSCLLCLLKQTCALQRQMSAMGQ